MNGVCYITRAVWLLAAAVIFATTATVSSTKGRAAAPQARVVGGSNVHISKFPFEVSVRRKPCTSCPYEHYCSGIIYQAHVIITAGNCVRNAVPTQTHVVVGTSYREGAARDGAVYQVDKFTLHQDDSVDIALIHLALDVPLDVYTTKAVAIATQTPRAGKMAIVAGWGQLEEIGAYSEQLREVQVPIVDHALCQSLYFWSDITEYEICAGYTTGGSDACHGDAGSPLVVDDKLVGIVSWGYGCARPNNPGVYTNVVALRDWIVSHA